MTWHVLICVVDNVVYMGTGNNSSMTWDVLTCVVDNVVYMGTVNNSSMAWHVLICGQLEEQVSRRHGILVEGLI